MENEEGYRWLSIPEVAARHEVSIQAIHDAIKNGRLRARVVHESGGRRHRQIREDWYEEWAREIKAPQRRRKPSLEQIGRRGAETVAV